ncbi:MAG TPA: TMEM175 family protein [Galbitalea sp.]|jgi:uncharacterized membrane protein
MENQRGVERLIFFTDAVVAIAITLLILPLVEIVTTDASKAHPTPIGTFVLDNLGQLFAFALSFAIIARFWIANHEILLNTVEVSAALMWLDIAWVFTIVVLPLPTEITAAYPPSLTTVSIYIGNGFLSTILLTAIAWYLHRHPAMQRKDAPISGAQIWGIGTTAIGFLVAFALAWIFPSLHYNSLFVLLLTFPADMIAKPRIRRREAARAQN